MAYFDTFDEEENKKSNQQPNTLNLSQESGVVDEGGNNNDTSSSNGTGFTNFQDYITANENSTGNINAINKVSDTFDVGVKDYSNFENEANNTIDKYSYDGSFFDSIESDPTTFTQNEDNISKWNDYLGASYTGPASASDLAGFDEQETDKQKTEYVADNWDDFDTRSSLINQSVDDSTYGRGQNLLDTFLLGGKQGQDFSNNLSNTVETNRNNWNNTLSNINNSINQEKQDIGRIRDRANNTFNSLNNRLDSNINAAKTQANNTNTFNRNANNETIASSLGIDKQVLDFLDKYNREPITFNDSDHWTDYTNKDELSAISSLINRDVDLSRPEANNPYTLNQEMYDKGLKGFNLVPTLDADEDFLRTYYGEPNRIKANVDYYNPDEPMPELQVDETPVQDYEGFQNLREKYLDINPDVNPLSIIEILRGKQFDEEQRKLVDRELTKAQRDREILELLGLI